MNQTRWELRHNSFTPSLHLVSFRQLPYSWNIWQGFKFGSLAVGNEAAEWKYYFCQQWHKSCSSTLGPDWHLSMWAVLACCQLHFLLICELAAQIYLALLGSTWLYLTLLHFTIPLPWLYLLIL